MLTEQSILLTENIENDGNVYEFLLHDHCSLHNVSHVSFDRQHGGGDDLPKVFDHLIQNHRVVCATVDSDKDSPSSTNQKLEKLLRMKQITNWPFGIVTSPPCRETENLIPMDIVMDLPSGFRNATNQLMLDVVKAEAGNGDPLENRYWLYFDTKLGLRTERFRRLAKLDEQWILGKLQHTTIDPTTRDIGGYGERIISQLFAESKYIKDFRTATRHQNWRYVFGTFLDQIVWLFVAGEKIVT
jgi:hypothetical protein